MKTAQEARLVMNEYGKRQVPFLFLTDFKAQNAIILNLDEIDPDRLLFDFNGYSNSEAALSGTKVLKISKFPVGFSVYKALFKQVMQEIRKGNSYLLNLTFETPVQLNYSLKEVFLYSKARYKLLLADKFVFFSPEIFIQTRNNKIFTYPMKGTIDAGTEDAEKEILTNRKEMSEHATVVDLLRNDLSMVAKNVRVEKYRYIDRIKTHDKELLQVSSEISGILPENFRENLGDIIFSMLPAGSISGAPKRKTVEIITAVENYSRGFFTGVCGIFDGKDIDSAVMIRFIENKNGQLVYKSGGGITINSNAVDEYNEMVDKIYVPVF